jgi:23S rRNA pseudouridine955/2504/2580 synthase
VGEGTGGKLDVTAELPPHFAMSMEVLGFDQGLSDASPMGDEAPERTGEEKKQAARRHFKQARKEARAPRRARGDAAAKPKAKGKPKGKGAKPVGKPAGKPVVGKGKPAPKGPGRKPAR